MFHFLLSRGDVQGVIGDFQINTVSESSRGTSKMLGFLATILRSQQEVSNGAREETAKLCPQVILGHQ